MPVQENMQTVQLQGKSIHTDVSFPGKTDRKSGSGRALHKYGFPQDGKMRRRGSRKMSRIDRKMPYEQQKCAGRDPWKCMRMKQDTLKAII